MPEPSAPVEKNIIAAEGGVIETHDGRLTLNVPAVSLPQDTAVSILPVEPNEVPGFLHGSESLGFAYRLEPSGLRFEKPVEISIRIPAGTSSTPGSDDEVLHFLFIQTEGENPELVDNLVTETTSDGDLVISGQINHFSWLFDLAVPKNETFCTSWNPDLLEYDETFSIPNTIATGNVSLAADLNLALKPNVTICAGFFDEQLEVSVDASVFENTTLVLNGNGTLLQPWISPTTSFPLGVVMARPIPIVPQIDLFVEAGVGIDAETSVSFEQAATATINVVYDGAWTNDESTSCQNSIVDSAEEFRRMCVQTLSPDISASGFAKASAWVQLSFLVLSAAGPYVRIGPALILEAGTGGDQPDWWTLCGELQARYGITGNPVLFGPALAAGDDFTLLGPALIDKSPPSLTTCGVGPPPFALPSITISPTSGALGTKVVVSGRSLAPSSRVSRITIGGVIIVAHPDFDLPLTDEEGLSQHRSTSRNFKGATTTWWLPPEACPPGHRLP